MWAALSYRRGLITALGHGQRVDRLNTGKGLTAELEKLRALWDTRQILAIHADLTSCLRAGDLLCIDPSDGAPYLLEIKASGRQAPPRQAERLEFLQAILDERVSTLSAETPAAPIECDLGLKAHHDVLGDLLRRAESETYVWTQPEPGLLITAVDESDPAGIGPSLDRHRAETVNVCLKVRRGPREITVPAPVRDQVLNELLSLESLIDILEWLVNERESAVSRTFGLDFSDERRTWTAGPFP